MTTATEAQNASYLAQWVGIELDPRIEQINKENQALGEFKIAYDKAFDELGELAGREFHPDLEDTIDALEKAHAIIFGTTG